MCNMQARRAASAQQPSAAGRSSLTPQKRSHPGTANEADGSGCGNGTSLGGGPGAGAEGGTEAGARSTLSFDADGNAHIVMPVTARVSSTCGGEETHLHCAQLVSCFLSLFAQSMS